MSTREKEVGTLSFTATGYMEVMRAIRALYNKRQDTLLDLASTLHKELTKITGRGAAEARKNQLLKFLRMDMVSMSCYPRSECLIAGKTHQLDDSEKDRLLKELLRGKGETLTKPRRTSFEKLTNKVASFSLNCDHYGELTLSKVTLTIKWLSDGHSCIDSAKESVYFKLFSSVMTDYKWRRNEGGAFYQTDEHGEDASDQQGIAYHPNLSEHYGPKGITIKTTFWSYHKKEAAKAMTDFMAKHGR